MNFKKCRIYFWSFSMDDDDFYMCKKKYLMNDEYPELIFNVFSFICLPPEK